MKILQRAGETLFRQVDAAPLVYLRIAFGVLILIDVVRYFRFGWIGDYFLEPDFLFTFYGFSWVKPWPGIGLYLHFAAMGLLAICVAAGFLYRLAAPLLFLAFTYVFLLDQANYLNHFYLLALLALLLALTPAHRAYSIDAWRRPAIRSATVPGWTLFLLRAQVSVVYVYAAIAKLNEDWLLHAQPLRLWLGWRADRPIIGPLLAWEPTAWFFSYGGVFFDLLVVPALLWRRTRGLAVAAFVAFHLINAAVFEIGIFPWTMLALTALLFLPGWKLPEPDRWRAASEPPAPGRAGRRLVGGFVTLWLLVQLLVPLRHWLYPGDVNWTEEGHRFSWRMKLRSKRAQATYHAVDPATGERWRVPVEEWLSERQLRRAAVRPDMVLQLAHHIAEREAAARGRQVQVFAEVPTSLNARPPLPLVDPGVDLAAQPRDLLPASWILPNHRPAAGSGDEEPAVAADR